MNFYEHNTTLFLSIKITLRLETTYGLIDLKMMGILSRESDSSPLEGDTHAAVLRAADTDAVPIWWTRVAEAPSSSSRLLSPERALRDLKVPD